MAFIFLLSFVLFPFLAAAKVVTYDWSLTWVWANPDGREARAVVGVNNEWPCPTIHVDKGDEVIVHIHNNLGNETTSMHWHGLYQHGTNNMDGPAMVTQCPIQPGSSYTYQFNIDQVGTYWYHAHDGGQYPDGLRGAFIVHDPDFPYAYDEELILTFSDWYHDECPSLINFYLSPEQNTDGGEPVPYSALLNDKTDAVLKVEPNKTYMLRIVSLAAFAQAYIWIDDHEFQIVEIDGIYTDPVTVDSIYIATAQRYSVLLTTKPTAKKNYAINAMMDDDDFDSVPDYVYQNMTATLQYNSALPDCKEGAPKDTFDNFDEFALSPYDRMPALTGKPDHSFVMNLSFFEQDDQNRAGFNNITWLPQKVPTLYSVLTSGRTALDADIYGVNSNTMVVHHNDLVEIVINNFDSGYHIMHLHGHAVQLVAKQYNVTDFGDNGSADPYSGDTSKFPAYPARRDTWLNAPYGYTVIRFRATNPGVWIIHCHMEWHVDAGLIATLIEAPLKIQEHQKIDPAMATLCKAQGVAIAGNAGANTENLFDLSNARTTCIPNPMGALIGPA